MKIVIDIPEKLYKSIKQLYGIVGVLFFGKEEITVIKAIKKSTPLSDIINTLDEMDLADYDYHTIQAIKQILNGDKTTY